MLCSRLACQTDHRFRWCRRDGWPDDDDVGDDVDDDDDDGNGGDIHGIVPVLSAHSGVVVVADGEMPVLARMPACRLRWHGSTRGRRRRDVVGTS